MTQTHGRNMPVVNLSIRRIRIDPSLGSYRPDTLAADLQSALAERIARASTKIADGIAGQVADVVWRNVSHRLPTAHPSAATGRSREATRP